MTERNAPHEQKNATVWDSPNAYRFQFRKKKRTGALKHDLVPRFERNYLNSTKQEGNEDTGVYALEA